MASVQVKDWLWHCVVDMHDVTPVCSSKLIPLPVCSHIPSTGGAGAIATLVHDGLMVPIDGECV